MTDAVLVLVGGGSSAGKSTLVRLLIELAPWRVTTVELDAYAVDADSSGVPRTNFDEPDSLDLARLEADIESLRSGRPTSLPVYDFAQQCRVGEMQITEPAKVIVLEGHLVLALPVRKDATVAVFVDAPVPVRLSRRIVRDTAERGRTSDSVLAQWSDTVLPMHQLHIEPSADEADLVVDGSSDLRPAAIALLNVITERLQTRL